MSWIAWSGHRWLALLARLYLGQLFLLAAVHKIAQPQSFAVDVATYQLLPLPLINLFAIVVPSIEVLIGMLLLLGLWVRGAAMVLGALMVSFMVALGWALYLKLDMTCGCFASQGATDEDPISLLTMARDAGWLILAGYVVFFDRKPLGLDRVLRRLSFSTFGGGR